MNFNDTLIRWYHLNKRDLPWRHTTDAYIIWLSEIILQQTRVEQGMPYFHRFAQQFRDVAAFAAATEDEVLKLWQGLGYYSRGRNMLKTARAVVAKHGGIFPADYDTLLTLTGIGEYTAAAISSFAANQAKAVVDGNVSRVLARYFGITEAINSPTGKKLVQQTANELLNIQAPGLHNQAMMEFGALQCKPQNPNCTACPFNNTCFALKHGQVNQIPLKLKTVKVRDRFFNYFLLHIDGQILLRRRGDTDIWANMYDLPLLETAEAYSPEQVLALPDVPGIFGRDIEVRGISPVLKHILTHQRIYARFFAIQAPKLKIEAESALFYTPIDNLSKLAMPKIIFQYLNETLLTHH